MAQHCLDRGSGLPYSIKTFYFLRGKAGDDTSNYLSVGVAWKK